MAGPGQSPGTAEAAAGAGGSLRGAIRAVIMTVTLPCKTAFSCAHRAGNGTGIESANRLVSPRPVPGTNRLPPWPGSIGPLASVSACHQE